MRPYVKKAIMEGKFKIMLMCFLGLLGRVLVDFGGHWGKNAIKRPYRAPKNTRFHYSSQLFDEKHYFSLTFANLHQKTLNIRLSNIP